MAMKYLALVSLLLNLAVVFSTVPKTTSEGGGYGDDYGHDQSGNNVSNFCPEAEAIIFSRVQEAVLEDSRMAASLLRLHFHDCFVNVCCLACFACNIIKLYAIDFVCNIKRITCAGV